MKLLDLQLHNFRKLSNLPQPTIAFNEDINVLVGANNAGKTSILKAVQFLFRTESLDVNRDANYLVQNGNLSIDCTVKFTLSQWKTFLLIAYDKRSKISEGIDSIATYLANKPISLRKFISFAGRKVSFEGLKADMDYFDIEKFKEETDEIIMEETFQYIESADFRNIYNTPLYFDSKGHILDREPVIALNQIENKQNQEKGYVRGLLYSLKRKEPKRFNDFKQRLLSIFTELEDIDVIHNEDVGEFQLVIHEKLRNNGDSQEVIYDINNVGQGMQTLVIMLSSILLLKPSIVLMDEPEVHMHPSLIKEFVGYIKKLSVDTQFIITTHSEVLIREVGLDKVFYLRNDLEQKGIIASKVDDKNQLLEAVNSLGYEVDSSVYTIKPSVFVFTEGPSDKDYIFAFAKKAGLESALNSFTTAFIEMGGKGNRYKFATLIEKLNQDFIDSPVLMILDKDETSNTTIEEITEKFFSKNPNRLHYLSKRQIENYLLDENAIKQLVSSKIKDVEVLTKLQSENINSKFKEFAEHQKEKILNNYLSEIFINESLVNTKNLAEILKLLKDKPLNQSVPEFTGELFRLVGMRTSELSHLTTTARTEFENLWNAPNNKIEMCDGRKLLKNLKTWIQDNYRVSFTDTEIIEAMQDIPTEIDELLKKLTKPELLKIESGS
jgi:predicted ATP-dependent endonuclease of OLD family